MYAFRYYWRVKYKDAVLDVSRVTCETVQIVLKPGFHYPSWRPELTGDRFPLPVNTGRVDGRSFPLAELVETGFTHRFKVLSFFTKMSQGQVGQSANQVHLENGH